MAYIAAARGVWLLGPFIRFSIRRGSTQVLGMQVVTWHRDKSLLPFQDSRKRSQVTLGTSIEQ
jgi:hypothetical protein